MINQYIWKGLFLGSLGGLIVGIMLGFGAGWGYSWSWKILPFLESTQDYMINEVQNNRANFNEKLIDNREPKKRR